MNESVRECGSWMKWGTRERKKTKVEETRKSHLEGEQYEAQLS